MSIEVRDVARFDQVRFRGPGTLKISQGDPLSESGSQKRKESLTIHAPGYVMRHVISEVKDGVLHVGYKSPKVTRLRVLQEVISYDLCMKDIRKVTVTGSGSLLMPDIDNDAVTVELNGSGKAKIEQLTADSFIAIVHGAGVIRVEGDVETQSILMNGAGRFEAENLVSDYAQVTLNGSGKANVSVSDELNVVINGSGLVTYAGFPEINKHISGSGRLERRRRTRRHSRQGEDHG